MVVTPSGIVSADKLLHSLKAPTPIAVSVSGSSTLVRYAQRWNAPAPMVVTPDAMRAVRTYLPHTGST